MSACETALAPGLAAYQQLTDAGRFCDLAAFDDSMAALCQGAAGAARNRALAKADEKMLCAVFCCCSNNPVPGEGGQGGYDTCASQTLSAAERFMDNDSRFKSQVSYNMRPDTPEPLMERGLFGGLTTESIPWTRGGIEHIKNRIGQDGFPYQSGDARRPDVVIVRDPSRPPTPDNVSRVVDFKFTDSLNRAQEDAYARIGGQPPLVIDSEKCDCSDDETRKQLELVTAAQSVVENDRSMLNRIGLGALGTVAAVATVALAIVPVDGPLGETAAGAGTMAAFSRAFAASGWTAARQAAAAATASSRWSTLYAGAM